VLQYIQYQIAGVSSVVRDQGKAGIVGIGLDNQDGDVRQTRGRNFHLVGGSQETHELMQEKCIKMNEKLSAMGKELQDLERKEFLDLADECRMNVLQDRPGEAK
jgi:hypothetical protein